MALASHAAKRHSLLMFVPGDRIRVMADYDCFPLWRDDPDGVSNIPPGEAGLPEELANELMVWADVYDRTLDRGDPLRSGFADADAEARFVAQGRVLAGRVAAAVGPGVSVEFVP